MLELTETDAAGTVADPTGARTLRKLADSLRKKKRRRQHPIRDGIIATIVGGVIVVYIVPSFRDFIVRAASEVAKWPGIIWNALFASYEVAGWVIVIGALCTLMVLVTVVVDALQRARPPSYHSYIEDFIDGVKWRWRWDSDGIEDLRGFCPACDANLVYRVRGGDPRFSPNFTELTCERCAPRNRQDNLCVVAKLRGDTDYVLDSVKREIARRIRTGEHARPTKG